MKPLSKQEEAFLGKVFGKIALQIEKIGRYKKDVSFEDYIGSDFLQDALSVPLNNIGEFLKSITGKRADTDKFGLMSAFPDIDWDGLKGGRDLRVHSYYSIIYSYPWEAITHDVPLLKAAIEQTCAQCPGVRAAMESEMLGLEYELQERRDQARRLMQEQAPSDEDDTSSK